MRPFRILCGQTSRNHTTTHVMAWFMKKQIAFGFHSGTFIRELPFLKLGSSEASFSVVVIWGTPNGAWSIFSFFSVPREYFSVIYFLYNIPIHYQLQNWLINLLLFSNNGLHIHQFLEASAIREWTAQHNPSPSRGTPIPSYLSPSQSDGARPRYSSYLFTPAIINRVSCTTVNILNINFTAWQSVTKHVLRVWDANLKAAGGLIVWSRMVIPYL